MNSSLNFDSKALAVILLNWNRADEVVKKISELDCQRARPNLIVVVDNGSGNKEQEFLKTLYSTRSDVAIIPLPQNIGYAGGINAGLRYITRLDFDYACALNTDTALQEDFLQKMLILIENNERVAIVQPKIVFSANPEITQFQGAVLNKKTLTLQHASSAAECAAWEQDPTDNILIAYGTGWMFRVSALSVTGLLDERLFAYFEDVEISLRMQSHGYHILLASDVTLNHDTPVPVAGRITRPPYVFYYSARNSTIVFRRWADWIGVGGFRCLLTGFLVSSGEYYRCVNARNKECSIACLEGILDSWFFVEGEYIPKKHRIGVLLLTIFLHLLPYRMHTLIRTRLLKA